MNKQQIKNKKEYAKALFLSSQQTQEEISNIIGVSRQTLNKWAKNENWAELRNAATLTPQKMISQLSKQLEEINKSILSREEGKRFATPKEADALVKISNTIKNLRQEMGLSEVVSVSMLFLNWLRKNGEAERGKELSNLFNNFIQDLATEKARNGLT